LSNPPTWTDHKKTTSSFNPSVGILSCRTRDSYTPDLLTVGLVSIPRSGFCLVERAAKLIIAINHFRFQSLGRDSVLSNPTSALQIIRETVSIPRSGFCLVEPGTATVVPVLVLGFNPSVGILSCRTFSGRKTRLLCRCFNPSVGILSCRTSYTAGGVA